MKVKFLGNCLGVVPKNLHYYLCIRERCTLEAIERILRVE